MRNLLLLSALIVTVGCHRGGSVSEPGRAHVGRVSIVCDPSDAIVYVDGEIVGEAAEFDGTAGFLELSPGRYTIEVKKEGHVPFHREVTVGEEPIVLTFALPAE